MDISQLASPSFLLSDLGSSFWTSIALLVAVFAAFVGAITRAKVALVSYANRNKSVITSEPVTYSHDDDDDDDVSDDEEEEDDDEDDDDEQLLSSSDEYESAYEEDRVQDGDVGSRPSWPDLAWGGAVVKTWEGLGLGAGFDRFGGGLISLLDLHRGETLRAFLAGAGQIPEATTLATPSVVLSAGNAAVRVWDARAAGEGSPAAAAEWNQARRRRLVGIAGGGEGRLYVGDEGGGVVVADLRSGRRSPLVEVKLDGGGQIPDAVYPAGRLPLLPSRK